MRRESGRAPRARWVSLSRVIRPRARLVIFPHAGGGPTALLSLARLCPEGTELWGLAMTGRDVRARDTEADDVADLVASVAAEFGGREPLPTVFLGCSLGALVAARAAHAHPHLCDALIVASQTPGDRDRFAEAGVDISDLEGFLLTAGMTEPEILEIKQIRDDLCGRLSKDLALVDDCATDFGAVRCDQDLYVLSGIDDPIAPVQAMSAWRGHSRGTTTGMALPGGHFAFLEPDNHQLTRMLLSAAFETADRSHHARRGVDRLRVG
ncbi:MAG: alpha/beta fold hydrolase [Corynebacteriales bacterium]|nr:alpha/beta fold hydrolase [Mycobacteriales bacterium]